MTITMYSTTTCTTCKGLGDWLNQKGFEYTKKNVDEDEQAMIEFMSLNDDMIGVPFTVIDDNGTLTKVSGYDRKSFTQALNM